MSTTESSGEAVSVASVSDIRAQFPALQRWEGSQAVAYFDGPGGTQVPLSVVNAMSEYLLRHNANTHWAYPTSVETDAILLRSRAILADFLGATTDQIAFGANMTTLLFHIARAIGRGLREGDEIIVTELDHHANIAPWQALARERGVVLRWLPLDLKTFRHEEGALERLLSPRTKVVAVGAASNILGTVSDVAGIVAKARAAGAITVVDAVHFAPHHLVDVQAMGADFVLCSAYKFYGPHVGVVYGRTEATAALDLPRLEPAPDWVPERLETGTQNHEGIAGAAAAVEFLTGLVPGDTMAFSRRARLARVMTELQSRGDALFVQLWEGLQRVDGVTLYGPPPGTPRTATLSFRVNGLASEEVARALVATGSYVSHGDFYATTVARKLGFAEEGFVRVGCACYTTEEEIARLLDGVKTVARGAA
ncbi:MAG TPA: cysteine desulfurase-like protein [Gemmatimonas aurantiaca]|uniref:Cysteine desulfurase-like protein n=1 Tax=Gemmatimonas aurantiaca TaxID=173480 RepID=A0A3D4VD45_9BACT|nr:cysteine desulfurase-like protein [Gemmatimonas aurantiaca]HCT58247.1 cysteine desulfurase-like protein [Gemmatimonas aurantiaca]